MFESVALTIAERVCNRCCEKYACKVVKEVVYGDLTGCVIKRIKVITTTGQRLLLIDVWSDPALKPTCSFYPIYIEFGVDRHLDLKPVAHQFRCTPVTEQCGVLESMDLDLESPHAHVDVESLDESGLLNLSSLMVSVHRDVESPHMSTLFKMYPYTSGAYAALQSLGVI
jgi:hypothetical protein